MPMSGAVSHSRETVDQVDLPLRLTTTEIEQIGRIIDDLCVRTRTLDPSSSKTGATDLLAIAQSIYRLRRIRDDAFEDRIFADPAWDILLDLFIAAERGKKVSISSACIGATVPATTALRHLSALVKHGLISRDDSKTDFRVSWVALSPTGHAKMKDVLTAYANGSP